MSAHSDPDFFEMLRERCQWPLVILDCQAPSLDADVIMEDPEQSGYEATRYLLNNGHESVACISGPANLSPSSQRLAGYHRALEESGIPAGNGWVIEGRLTAESGFEAANRLLDDLKSGDEPPTALFVGNDLMAMGVICALQTRGYRIPDDISVVGYDDIELASFTSPPLTTIHQPKGELGRLAADTLIKRIENPELKPEIRTLRSTLVERQSVKTASL
jgi:DNA-binding LacI/PurR family transcriptional regulator